jgi:hypothetical protein
VPPKPKSKAQRARELRLAYPELTAGQIMERIGMTRAAYSSALQQEQKRARRASKERRT